MSKKNTRRRTGGQTPAPGARSGAAFTPAAVDFPRVSVAAFVLPRGAQAASAPGLRPAVQPAVPDLTAPAVRIGDAPRPAAVEEPEPVRPTGDPRSPFAGFEHADEPPVADPPTLTFPAFTGEAPGPRPYVRADDWRDGWSAPGVRLNARHAWAVEHVRESPDEAAAVERAKLLLQADGDPSVIERALAAFVAEERLRAQEREPRPEVRVSPGPDRPPLPRRVPGAALAAAEASGAWQAAPVRVPRLRPPAARHRCHQAHTYALRRPDGTEQGPMVTADAAVRAYRDSFVEPDQIVADHGDGRVCPLESARMTIAGMELRNGAVLA